MVSSTFKTIVLVVGVVIPLFGGSRFADATPPSKVLAFEGTVVSIGQIAHERTPFLVTVKVKGLVSGEFSGPTFSFAVHSPAQSGLEKGRSYVVEAAWKDGGYVVDELQWRRLAHAAALDHSASGASTEVAPIEGPETKILGQVTGLRSVRHRKSDLEPRLLEARRS